MVGLPAVGIDWDVSLSGFADLHRFRRSTVALRLDLDACYFIYAPHVMDCAELPMPLRLIQGASFDPATTQLMGLAYDRACEGVSEERVVRELIARRIIEAAKRGERNLGKLIEYGRGREDGVAEAG